MFRSATLRLAPVFVLAGLLAPSLHADEAEQLLSDSLAVYNTNQTLNKRMGEDTRALQSKASALHRLERELGKPVDEDAVEESRERVRQLREQLDQLEARLAAQEELLGAMDLSDEERAQKAAEAKAELTKVQAEITKASEPWRTRMQVVQSGVSAERAAMQELMTGFGFVPGNAPYNAVTEVTCNATPHDAFIWYAWHDSEKKQLAWAHVRLRDKPEADQSSKLLGGKHRIQSSNDSSCWVWAGHFQIAFVFSHDEWNGEGKPVEAIAQFLDLDGMAQLDATLPPSDDVKQAIEKATEGLDAE